MVMTMARQLEVGLEARGFTSGRAAGGCRYGRAREPRWGALRKDYEAAVGVLLLVLLWLERGHLTFNEPWPGGEGRSISSVDAHSGAGADGKTDPPTLAGWRAGWLAECGRSANRVLSRGARCELEKNHPLRRSASVSTLKILGSSDAQQNPAERAVQRTDQIPRLLARYLDRSGSPPRAPPNAVRVRKSF
ncbi:hypothetical protein L1887_49068 [Cichorium endivia]|nr:hypothetical protein L1887_49068 [Cichorium endivia]